MPEYDYKCANCGEMKLTLKMSEVPIKECPKCQCKDVERVFAPTPSIWKCSGAYGKERKT